MQSDLITAGLFAKLARTTKRTILWYDQLDLLKPALISENSYRYYEPKQIIDFQVIHLLRMMHFSIQEIKTYLSKNYSLKDLFKLKQEILRNEIDDLERKLSSIKSYYSSLERFGTLCSPEISVFSSRKIYSIEKSGPYAKIKDYCFELKSYFKFIPEDAIYLTIFYSGYEPKKARMKIGVIAKDNMELKSENTNLVKLESLPSFKALRYVHNGSGTLVSLLWQDMEKFKNLNGLVQERHLPFVDLEIYITTSMNGQYDEDKMVFELYLPIE